MYCNLLLKKINKLQKKYIYSIQGLMTMANRTNFVRSNWEGYEIPIHADF